MLCLFLSTRGLCCSRCFDSLWVCLTLLTAATSFTPPHTLVCPSGFRLCTVANYVCLFLFFFSIFSHLLHSNLLRFLQLLFSATLPFSLRPCCFSLNTPPDPTAPLSAGPLLCCVGPQKRSGQMVSDDFRALLISTGNSLVLLLLLLLLCWHFRVSAGPKSFIDYNAGLGFLFLYWQE